MYDNVQERETRNNFDGLYVREVLPRETLPCGRSRGRAHERVLEISVHIDGVSGALLEI
jgi:hypothetical protein